MYIYIYIVLVLRQKLGKRITFVTFVTFEACRERDKEAGKARVSWCVSGWMCGWVNDWG